MDAVAGSKYLYAGNLIHAVGLSRLAALESMSPVQSRLPSWFSGCPAAPGLW